MSSYSNGSVLVTTNPTLVCTTDGENDGIIVQNTGSVTIYLGGPTVAASGAHLGISLAASALITLPSSGPAAGSLYAITASSTATVAYLYS